MSRSGYSDDPENFGLWRGAVDRAIAGKRGQAFLREMAAALDAMPEKVLIAHEIVADGDACAIGAVALSRGMDVSDLHENDPDEVARRFGIARALVCEIAYENDEGGPWLRSEAPAERWKRMRRWVEAHLKGDKTKGDGV